MTGLVSEEAVAFRESAERLLKQGDSLEQVRLDPPSPRWRETWQAMGEAGWFRILLPEECDGLGLTFVELGQIFQEVGVQPLRGPLLESAVCVPLVAAAAGEACRARLEPCLNGEAVACLVEPLESPYGGTIVVADGHLKAEVPIVPFASEADVLLVTAQGEGGPFVLCLDPALAKIEQTRSVDPCVSLSSVCLNCPVPDDAVVLTGPAAQLLIDRMRSARQLMIAAEIAGGTVKLTEMSVEYAKIRRQFGRAIGEFQAIQHMLAGMSVRSAALVNLASAMAADVAADDRRLFDNARIAKAFASETGRYIAEEAIQVHGGIGFTEELPLHIYYRRVLSVQGRLGETEALQYRIGQDILRTGAMGGGA
jgi:alkylation response protein AidB-like acyl-CoA dehydrogenase